MSLLLDYSTAEVTSFGGPDQLTDPSMVQRNHALLARNVEYSAGSVGTRHGFGAVSALPSFENAYAIYEWIAPFSQINSSYADNAVVVVTNGNTSRDYKVYNLNTAVASGLMMNRAHFFFTAASASVVGVGMRLYSAQVDNKQHGFSTPLSVRTFYSNAGTIANYDNFLFSRPVAFSPAATEPGAGLVTAGVHRLGYLLEYASGFTTRVSPDTSSSGAPSLATFAPISVTASGSKNIRLTFTSAWTDGSSNIVAVSAVMTTTTDLNQYYVVPGSRTAISPTGTAPAFTIDISVSDSDLSSQGVDATPYLYWLTNSAVANAQPFVTRHISLLGTRMGYLASQTDNVGNTVDALYISEPNNYQAITADQHILQLPGQRPMVTMFRMGSVNYIVGPSEIWATTDNNDVPASWAASQLIDGRHGTQAIHGIEVAPSGNYAWLADQGGLYLFTGAPITSLPVSYYQTPDWNRINWGSAYCVKIRDDASNKRVHVMVPLDGAATPSHIMTWDYTNGANPGTVMYSLDSLSGYSLGAMELVRNDLQSQATGNTGKVELWLGSSANGGARLLRKTSDADATPYQDNGAAISSLYRTAPLPGRSVTQGQIQMHHGFHARLKGAGTISPTVYDIDAVRSFPCAAQTLAAAPDQDTLVLARMRNELAFVEFSQNALDQHWVLSYLKWYYSEYLMQR